MLIPIPVDDKRKEVGLFSHKHQKNPRQGSESVSCAAGVSAGAYLCCVPFPSVILCDSFHCCLGLLIFVLESPPSIN